MTDCSRGKHPGRSVPAWIYGTTKGSNWDRQATEADVARVTEIESDYPISDAPQEILWGELHFYTARNYIVMSKLWKLAETYQKKMADALAVTSELQCLPLHSDDPCGCKEKRQRFLY